MKSSPAKRRVLAILFGGLVLAIVAIAFWPGEREPEYQGKKLSYWLELCRKRSTGVLTLAEIEEGPQAIRRIGTNALPYLVKWIQYEPPPYHDLSRLERAWIRLRMRLRLGQTLIGRREGKQERRVDAAVIGFEILGPSASPAVPELSDLLYAGQKPYTSRCAMLALGYIGTEGLPPLLKALADPNHWNRIYVATLLARPDIIGTNAHWVVPALAQFLDDPDLAATAAEGLSRLKAEPQFMVTELIKAAGSTNYRVRCAVWDALSQIAPQVLATNGVGRNPHL